MASELTVGLLAGGVGVLGTLLGVGVAAKLSAKAEADRWSRQQEKELIDLRLTVYRRFLAATAKTYSRFMSVTSGEYFLSQMNSFLRLQEGVVEAESEIGLVASAEMGRLSHQVTEALLQAAELVTNKLAQSPAQLQNVAALPGFDERDSVYQKAREAFIKAAKRETGLPLASLTQTSAHLP